MPSSISSSDAGIESVIEVTTGERAKASEHRAYFRAIVCLVLLLVVFFAVLEVASARLFRRSSNIQRRIAGEHEAALKLRATEQGNTTVLLIGNSLLMAGVDMEQLRAATANDISVVRYGIENTAVLDWYYGLKTLLSQGSRPAAVVLVMAQAHFVTTSTYGAYFAHYMMSPGDVL